MRSLHSFAWLFSLGLALALGATACGGAPSAGSPGHGVVLEIDPEARQVTLDHEDIPGVMKAMTMTFEVAPGVALDGIEAGTEVDFRVREADGGIIVTEIRRSGS